MPKDTKTIKIMPLTVFHQMFKLIQYTCVKNLCIIIQIKNAFPKALTESKSKHIT